MAENWEDPQGITKEQVARGELGPTTLAQLKDVLITSPADGDKLTFDHASGLWKNTP